MIDFGLLLIAGVAVAVALRLLLRSYRNPWRMLLLSMPLLIVLTPGFGSAPAVRIEEVLLFALAPFIILRRPLHKLARLELLFLLYGIAVLVSIFAGYLLDGNVFLRDYFELVRLAKYWLLVRLAISLPWSEENAADAVKLLLWTGLIASCIAFAQTRDSFAINSFYTPLFIKDFRLAKIQHQVAGTIQNYNLFGAFLAMVASVALSVLLFAKVSRRKKATVLFVLAAVILAMTRTTSRGSLLALLLSAACLCLLRLVLVRTRRAFYGGVLLIALVGGSLLVPAALGASGSLAKDHPLQALASRFQAENLEVGFTIRLSDWQYALDLASESWVFGTGPSKDEEIQSFHSEYLTHLRRYGLFGLTIYVLLLGTVAVAVFRCLRWGKKLGTMQRGYSMALLAGTLGVICVFVVTAVVYQVFQQLQLAAIFWWYVGIAYASCSYTRRVEAIDSRSEVQALQSLRTRSYRGRALVER
jgi:O-antigen ligase